MIIVPDGLCVISRVTWTCYLKISLHAFIVTVDVFITEVSWMLLSLKSLGCFYHWSLLNVFITEVSWMFFSLNLSLKCLGCFYHWSLLDVFITEVSWMFFITEVSWMLLSLKSLGCFYYWSLFDAFITEVSLMLLSLDDHECYYPKRSLDVLSQGYMRCFVSIIESFC